MSTDSQRKNIEMYKRLLEQALADGIITEDERAMLDVIKKKLGITEEDQALIEDLSLGQIEMERAIREPHLRIYSADIIEKAKKMSDISKIDIQIQNVLERLSIIDTNVLVTEAFLKFGPAATLSLLLATVYVFPYFGQLSGILILTIGVSFACITFVMYKLRIRLGRKSYQLNGDLAIYIKRRAEILEKMIHKIVKEK